MKQLDKSKYENVSPLFQANYPNLPIIFAIIENLIPGQIWVDHEDKPRMCIVMSGTSYCFIKGEINEEAFKECFKILKQKQIIKLAIEPDPAFDLSTFGFVPIPRRQYRYKDSQRQIPFYKNNSGYLIKKIEDVETFNQCIWKPFLTEFFGSAKNFLENGIGFILWDSAQQIIASEAYGILSKKFIEVGTITHEKYRRQNLSTILCNHLIRFALEKNIIPIWTCDEENFMSWKVAEKQGMNDLTRYTFHRWTQP